MRGQYVFLIPNLQICIHFLYSLTIYNDSAFYLTEIIVLISWEGTPTRIRMRVGGITFDACGGTWWVSMSSLCQNPEILIRILYLVTICSVSASYFLEMRIIILMGILTQIRMGLGCITFPGIGPRRGQYAFLMSKSRMLIYFHLFKIIVLGFQPLIFLKWVCLLDR